MFNSTSEIECSRASSQLSDATASYCNQWGPELVSQGLKTFELCVDNLTSEYFDPILEPVIDDIMQALFKHLKPLPHNHQHSHICLRILGKLGGRNRKYLQVPADLENLSVLEQEVSVLLDINGLSEKKPLKMTPAIHHALLILEDTKMESHYRTHAFKYLSTALKLMIDTTLPSPDYVEKYMLVLMYSWIPRFLNRITNLAVIPLQIPNQEGFKTNCLNVCYNLFSMLFLSQSLRTKLTNLLKTSVSIVFC